MDISKLPRLSKTDTPAYTPEPPGADGPAAPPGGFEPVMTTSAPAVGYCTCGAPIRSGARFCDSCGAPVAGAAAAPVTYIARDAGVGAEVWLSAIIGAFLILMGKSFGGWLIAKLTGQPYSTGMIWDTDDARAGQPVGYWDVQNFAALNDSAIFLFGVAMVLEAVVLAIIGTRFRQKVALVSVALLVTVLATSYNLFVSIKLLTANTLPMWSMLAVGFGGYIAVFEWRLLQQLRPTPVRA